ncbi:hypothetical protein RRG08_067130 [Elysia crispata]|uniref:Peptidase M12B domain-containing protein n=1 Tax=Elysia crispata TaxID=231223 RepID=A0AAE0ZR19_9GAST|nr:hypothetical protein RRG08_067130 [Elysia crispata]
MENSQKVLLTRIFVTFLISLEVSSMSTREEEGLLVGVQLVLDYSNPDARVRREADSNLPDHLSFLVPTAEGDVTLHMRRSRLLPTSMLNSNVTRLFSQPSLPPQLSPAPFQQAAWRTRSTSSVSNTAVLEPLHENIAPFAQNFPASREIEIRESPVHASSIVYHYLNVAVYTDIGRHASMIVRRTGGDYTLRGSFHHNLTEWHMEPAARVRRQTGGVTSHRLVRGRPKVKTVSFAGDAIIDDEPPVEILSLEERNRYSLERLARLRGKGDNLNQRAVTGRPKKTKTGDKSKMAAVEHIVEMVFVVDYADYERFVNYYGSSEASNELTVWYTYVAEGINIRYRTIIDPDIVIGTKVILLKVLTTDAEDDFIEDLVSSGAFNGGQGLDAFRNWIQDGANGIPNADHYMYFTGFSISGAVGIAYLSRVCTASGVSITVNDFSAFTAEVAAHELGHSLSALHDGNSPGCSDSTMNIMNAISSLPIPSSVRGNPWRFSSCSISFFKSYLDGYSCTEPSNTGSTDALPAPTGDARAGIALDRDDQCKLFFESSSSGYCSSVQNNNGGEGNLCSGMYCTNPSSPGSCRAMIPLEYTNCGSGKWCRTGFCLDEGVEPTNPPAPPPGPETIFDCIPFLLRLDFFGLLSCLRDVLFG